MSNDTYTGNYTLDDYASSTVALIDALKLDKPNILGVSLGSLITQTVAVNYGSDVTNVVLCDTLLMGKGILAVPNPISGSNVFVAAQVNSLKALSHNSLPPIQNSNEGNLYSYKVCLSRGRMISTSLFQ